MGGTAKEITSKSEWDEIIANAKEEGKVVIVDFSATWCGPCKVISPLFEELSTKFIGAIFLKVDVDAVEDVAAACAISAMPTFQVWKDGAKVDEQVGASKEKLNALCAKHAS